MPSALEDRVEADRAVFAKSASLRRLSNAPIPTGDTQSSSTNQEHTLLSTARSFRRNTSVLSQDGLGGSEIHSSSPLRRPATAATLAHSRIHQALRRSENEFVFSSKQSTVDGLLYSSRFNHLEHLNKNRPSSSSSQPHLRRQLAFSDKNTISKLKATTPAAKPEESPRSASSSESRAKLPSNQDTGGASSDQLQPHRRRASSGEAPAYAVLTADSSAETAATKQQYQPEESSLMQRKRRCAKTFEEMILARLREAKDLSAREQNLASILNHGIIQSVLGLSAIPDSATQAHCCRALYYLSQVASARKPMVAHGVVGTIKALSRITATKPRQDLAATLCHLSEENGLVEVLLFEGIDRSLARMFTSPSPETKRICALTVFNISVDAVTIKHFVDAFSQLLVTSTRASSSAASGNLIKAVYNAALAPGFHCALLGENIPRFLAHQLPNVPPTVQILALRALVALCDSKTNRAQILSQGFCNLLESMLTSTNEAIQETTLLILLLLSIDEGSRIKLCTWIPAATIVQTASQHVDNVDDDAACDRLVGLHSCVLRNLCDSVLTHHELVEEGAVQVLLKMSRMEDSDVKSNAICALCCIIASSTEESAGYVLEITDELIALTNTGTAKNCVFAVGALYNIACSDECLSLLAQSPRLLERILELAGDPPEERVAELVAAIIYRLTSIEDTQQQMLQQGVFPVLVHLIHHFPSGRTYAVNALFLLAQDGGEHFPHGGEEVARLAVALSEQGKGTTAIATSADDFTTLRSAVTLLAHLARHPKNHCALVRHGAVFRFLKQLKRLEEEETILINCAFVYFCLTATQEGCEQLIKELGMEDIIHLSRTSKLATNSNQMVKELCMLALCRLSSFIGLEVRLIEHGAIDAVMIMALVTTDSPLIKALCIKTLANCLVAKNCARPLIDHGIIWALSSLCLVDSPETRYACAVSLCNLSAVTNMLSRFLDAGAPRALIHLLKTQRDHTTVMATIKAIANLVANEKICAVFLNEELEKHLSVHFSDPESSEELRQLAAMVLLRVTSANDAMISLERLKNGVFVWMEQIIIMKEADLVRNCMLTVHDLTCNSTIDVTELDVEHILRIVIQVFQRHQQNEEIVTLCLSIVYNLTCQLSVVPRLVIPEIMLFLRQQVPTSCEGEQYRNTRKANIGGEVTATPSCSPAPHSSVTDVKLCCLILHNLSCHTSPAIDLLAALVNFHAIAILNDIYALRDDLKEICAIATCNIVVGKVNSSRVLEDHASDLLLHFIFSTYFRESHYHLVSASLRKLVNAPGNQQILLNAGIVKAIVFMLALPEMGNEPSVNLLAALRLLSKCSHHLSKLLDDGVLASVICIAEAKVASTAVLGYCFEILTNVCSVNFENHVKNHPEINVIGTLTKLSEHHYQSSSHAHHHQLHHHKAAATPSFGPSPSSTASSPTKSSSGCYYDRGEGKPLGVPQLLKFMMKSPSTSSSLKKNLELHTTYTVPARKWVPDAHPIPKDPPPLVCDEIPLTETSQSIPPDVKQRIRDLVPLPKEVLVRDEAADERIGNDSSSNGSSHNLNLSNASGGMWDDLASGIGSGVPDAFNAFTAAGGGSKKLQRGVAGRNLSRSGPSSQSRSGILLLP